MSKSPVAQYAYDAAGRLREVWDPRVSPALKTAYDYDAAGHVIGQQARRGQQVVSFRCEKEQVGMLGRYLGQPVSYTHLTLPTSDLV